MNRISTLALCLMAITLAATGISTAVASAAACTGDTWTNAAGGEWETAGNWSEGVPKGTSHVCIEKAVTVTMTDGQTSPIPVASLDLGGEGAAAQLHVSIHDVVESPVTTIGANAALTLDGTYHGANAGNASLRGGSVENRGTIVMEGSGYSATLAGTIVNEGTIDVPFGSVAFGEGGNGGPGSLVNRGTIHVSPASAEPAHPAEVEVIGIPVSDEAGAIVNEGAFLMKGGSSYTQGNGGETGNPIRIGQQSALAYTGAGSSNIEVSSGIGMTGNIVAGQKLQLDIGTVVTVPSSFTSAGTIVLNGTYFGSGGGPAKIALTSGTFTNTGSVLTESSAAFAGSVVNAGTVTIAPNSELELIGGTFTNTGILTPEFSSKASSDVRLVEGAHFVAGGTLAPALTEGFVPTIGQEFEIVLEKGGTYSGQFAAVVNGFGADYTHTGYIAAIYGEPSRFSSMTNTGPPPATATHPGTLRVKAIHGGHGNVEVTLTCAAGGSGCSSASITVAITEHLKSHKVSAITARSRTKRVTIASGAITLAAGATRTKTVTLTHAALALLAKRGSLPAAVVVRSAGTTLKTTDVRIAAVKPARRK